jgi:hypothetical protein
MGFSHGLLLGRRQTSSRQPLPAALTARLCCRSQARTSRLMCQAALSQTNARSEDPRALGRERLGHPGEKGTGHRADRPPVDEAQQHARPFGQPQPVAGQRLRLGIGAIGGVHPEAQRLARGPGAQRRLRQAGEPDLVGEAERPARTALAQPDQPVAATFLRA